MKIKMIDEVCFKGIDLEFWNQTHKISQFSNPIKKGGFHLSFPFPNFMKPIPIVRLQPNTPLIYEKKIKK